ncbi:MAG: hypothetical protein KDI07_18605 [Anaerolineae bacterium]|nr:hypothetical protein [Anaerolineae bacterium]MCB9133019.1 hypothetical protein [Anaerolineales bacterium]MCB0231180.1 hypothetical protein [Anaerolineae bacterium]MCB0235177.1 hypothetical protein [Anaerolineae bacterium]MCB0238232.1 hypothetical protein [Anaerolineae bacterium]
MNYGALIGRAWQLTWRYKVLWIFGILLALTAGAGTAGGGGGNGTSAWTAPSTMLGSEEFLPALASIVLLCCCAFVFLVIVAVIVQYVARAALYRSVDQIEETSTGPTWREGFRLGWSSRTLRMFLLDLIVGVLFFFAALLLLVVGATPLILLVFDNDAVRVLAILATIGLESLVILGLVVAGVIISVLGQFWRREIALADRSVGEAFSGGVALARRGGGSVGIMWLLLTVIGVVFGLAMAVVFFGLGILAFGAGGGLGYALYALTDSPALAALVGLPIFLVIIMLPSAIIRGIYLVFDSSAWTLIYREVAGSTTTDLVAA